MRVVRTIQRDVMDYVAERMPPVYGETIRDGNYAGLGVLSEDGELLAGVIYNSYQPKFGTLQVHVAASDPRWATRGVIREILGYAFIECQCDKVWSTISSTLYRVLRFNTGIGFTIEGVMRHQFGRKNHAFLTGMTKAEYRKFYLEPEGAKALFRHRQKVQVAIQGHKAA